MATIEELARQKQRQLVNKPSPQMLGSASTYHATDSKPMLDLTGIVRKGMENRQKRETQQSAQPKPVTPAAKPDVNNLINRYTNALDERVNQAPAQVKAPDKFDYNPYTDPAYQSALRLARRNLATSQSNTNARLRARGQGNSSYSETLAHQLSNNAMQNISDTVVPTYMNQAYQRYRDTVGDQFKVNQENYNRSRNQLGDMGNFLGTLQGMEQTDYNRQQDQLVQEAQAKQARIDLANQLAQQYGTNVTPTYDTALTYDQVAGLKPLNAQQFEYGQQQDAIANDLREREFEREGQQFAQQLGYDWAQLTQRQREQLADEAYRRKQMRLQQQQQDLNRDEFNFQVDQANKPEPVQPVSAEQYATKYIDDLVKYGEYPKEGEVLNEDQIKAVINTAPDLTNRDKARLYLRYGFELPAEVQNELN